MTTSKSGIPAVGDLLTFVGANLQTIQRDRASRALALLRTGSSGLEHPIVSAVQVPFNKVPQAVIHPDSGEIFFVGVSDKSGDDKPVKLCKLTLSGRPLILDVAPRIEHLMMLGSKVAYVVVDGDMRELQRMDGTHSPKECYPLGRRGYAPEDEKILAFNGGRTFAHERAVPSSTFDLVGEGVRNSRGGNRENRHGLFLNVFDNDLFYVGWDSERERNNITVFRENMTGGVSSRHENGEFINGSAFCDTDGTVWYVIFDRRSKQHQLYSLSRGGHVEGQCIVHDPRDVHRYLCSGHHGFRIELQQRHPQPDSSDVTHLRSNAIMRGLRGRVYAIEVVKDKAVFVLTKDESSCYLYVWEFGGNGELSSGKAAHADSIMVGVCDLRLIRFGNRVGLGYTGNNHRIVWQVDGPVVREFPLFAPVDRLTPTGNGRVLSWHFDAASHTFFITDYTPYTID